jgi:hypothetical protein
MKYRIEIYYPKDGWCLCDYSPHLDLAEAIAKSKCTAINPCRIIENGLVVGEYTFKKTRKKTAC